MGDWDHHSFRVLNPEEFTPGPLVDDPEPVDLDRYTPFAEVETAPYQFEFEDWFHLDIDDLDLSSIGEQARAEHQRLEYAIRGAILAGYDGVDVHRGHYSRAHDIVPWAGEPPELSGRETVERFCWPWFDEDELAEIAATGEVPPALLGVEDGE